MGRNSWSRGVFGRAGSEVSSGITLVAVWMGWVCGPRGMGLESPRKERSDVELERCAWPGDHGSRAVKSTGKKVGVPSGVAFFGFPVLLRAREPACQPDNGTRRDAAPRVGIGARMFAPDIFLLGGVPSAFAWFLTLPVTWFVFLASVAPGRSRPRSPTRRGTSLRVPTTRRGGMDRLTAIL
jgi:hypothetical protein